MATIKKGMLTHIDDWCVHLRQGLGDKRFFWKKERQAEKTEIEKRLREVEADKLGV